MSLTIDPSDMCIDDSFPAILDKNVAVTRLLSITVANICFKLVIFSSGTRNFKSIELISVPRYSPSYFGSKSDFLAFIVNPADVKSDTIDAVMAAHSV